MKKTMMISMMVVVAMMISGCASMQQRGEDNRGTLGYGVAGAGLGAIAGAVAGNNVEGINKGEGAIAGAALGAAIGAAVGHQSDNSRQNYENLSNRIDAQNSVVVNVTNSNGSITPVVLRKVGNQYLGPRGEYYNVLPTEKDLKGPYGF